MYEFSLTLMDQALNLPIESPTQPDIEWEKAYSMIQKMRKTRSVIIYICIIIRYLRHYTCWTDYFVGT